MTKKYCYGCAHLSEDMRDGKEIKVCMLNMKNIRLIKTCEAKVGI